MYNLALNEQQRNFLVTALEILSTELDDIAKAATSSRLKSKFQDESTQVENLLYVVKQTPDAVLNDVVLRQQVLGFLAKGDKIGAIKFVRQNREIGLKEAKDFVDNIQ